MVKVIPVAGYSQLGVPDI